ncbi:MAG: FAD-dependent oxidoreductase [Planctomycetota bacterium]|nr:MAG: FAD-dependent oxidoreductase [Planctomycetota bacterium]
MSVPKIVIVGGVAGGASAATRARRMNESAEIVIFERGRDVSFANCGLPYHICEKIKDRKKLLLATPEYFKNTFRIRVCTQHEVTRIDRKAKRVEVVELTTGRNFHESYDKLILAPGADPIVPPWKGINCDNVFTLRDLTDMDRIKAYVSTGQAKQAVVIGAGYIGLEMVEVLSELGLNVSLVELEPQVMPLLDPEMAREIQIILRNNDVELYLGSQVENLVVESDSVKAVKFANGKELAADMVLISIGVRPNTKLAVESGLTIGSSGAISVNEFMQTNDPDIYAAGDAVEVVHGVTGQPMLIPLAGPANRNGRLAGKHAATGRVRSATPALGTATVGIFGKQAAMTGLSSKEARKSGIPYDVSYAIRPHHAGYYPGAEQMILKLIYDPESGRILGAQSVGGAGVDKRIDVMSTTIHFRGTIDDLAGLDLAYAPQFGSAKDPIHIAAFVAQNQSDGLIEQRLPGDVPDIGQLIDVRSEAEFAAGSLQGARNIPLSNIRDNLSKLNKDEPVYVYCGVGQRSYNAARILMQSGFKEVWNLAGGYRLNKQK